MIQYTKVEHRGIRLRLRAQPWPSHIARSHQRTATVCAANTISGDLEGAMQIITTRDMSLRDIAEGNWNLQK